MFNTEVQKMAQGVVKKIDLMERAPLSYLVLSAFAGIYLAFGIGLIFFIGAPLAASGSPVTKLVMGMAFGLALLLVIFAGAELFTGNNMFGVIGALSEHVSWSKVLKLWGLCYLGNLMGSLFLAWLLVQSGLFAGSPQLEFIQKVTAAKMNAPLWQLFVRGILANWLVCLAVWMASRVTSEAAKVGLIAWCLFAFVAPGFEHSIANMSALAMGLFLPHPDTISWAGYVRNLIPSTLGNILSGGLFVGGLYWLVSPVKATLSPADSPREVARALAAVSR